MKFWIIFSFAILLIFSICFVFIWEPLSRATFEVHAVGAVSAEVVIGGKATKLKRDGARFVGSVPVDRADYGKIYVQYPNRATIVCDVHYVTGGLHDEYKIEYTIARGLHCDSAPLNQESS